MPKLPKINLPYIRPSAAPDHEHRAHRKKLENEHPAFGWTKPILFGLMAVTLAMNIEKEVKKHEERHHRREGSRSADDDCGCSDDGKDRGSKGRQRSRGDDRRQGGDRRDREEDSDRRRRRRESRGRPRDDQGRDRNRDRRGGGGGGGYLSDGEAEVIEEVYYYVPRRPYRRSWSQTSW